MILLENKGTLYLLFSLSSIFIKTLIPPQKCRNILKKLHHSSSENALRCVYSRTVDEIIFDCGAFLSNFRGGCESFPT
jgi:hypothetical protein